MHYYSHHIGDFDKATRHLTRIERSVYRDLIELYYETEQQLPLDINWLCRRIIARAKNEIVAVEQVLNEFFIKTPNGWYNDQCEEDLESYRTSNSQKSAAGRASAEKRAMKRQQALSGITLNDEVTLKDIPTEDQRELNETSTELQRDFNGASTNQEPRTINQEPLTNKKIETHRGSRLPSDWIACNDFIEFCETERPDLDVQAMQNKFRDYWSAVPGKNGLKTDWLATWRNFVRSEKSPIQHARAAPQFKTSAEKSADWMNRMRGSSTDSKIIDLN